MVAPQVKADRCDRLAELERELRNDYFRSLIGRRLTVLVEGASETTPESWVGTSCRYAPVEVVGRDFGVGDLVNVEAQAIQDGFVVSTKYP